MAALQRPHISLNLAISADGKITSAGMIPAGWTSRADHERLRALRAGCDALLVGRGTQEADRMTLASQADTRPPLRCVVSRYGGFDLSQPLFHTAGGQIHLLVTEPAHDFTPVALEAAGAAVHTGSLASFLETLSITCQVGRLHCEGGGELVRHLAALDVIDEIHLTWAAHTLFGGGGAPTLTGLPGDFFGASLRFEPTHFEPTADGECFLSYRRVR